jgi:hypothetical protein
LIFAYLIHFSHNTLFTLRGASPLLVLINISLICRSLHFKRKSAYLGWDAEWVWAVITRDYWNNPIVNFVSCSMITAIAGDLMLSISSIKLISNTWKINVALFTCILFYFKGNLTYDHCLFSPSFSTPPCYNSYTWVWTEKQTFNQFRVNLQYNLKYLVITYFFSLIFLCYRYLDQCSKSWSLDL